MSSNKLTNPQKHFRSARTIRFFPRVKNLLLTATLTACWAPGALAACGSAHLLSPGVASTLQLPALPHDPAENEVAPSDSTGSTSASPSMTGLWKTVFVADGAVVNIGFNTWHDDGSEWALDGGFPPAGGNVCPGVWEKVGPRSYRVIHPSFNYDPSNTHVAGIFVERLRVTITPDGKYYYGKFYWDSYDLQGNPVPGSVAGKITGTRITVSSGVPFPFPQ